MFGIPQLPAWSGIHPLIVHFPIVLLLLPPPFILLGLLMKKSRQCMALVALLLMATGSVAAFITVESGEAAERMVQITPEISSLLEKHSELGEMTRNVFSGLTVGYLLLLMVTLMRKKELRPGIYWMWHLAFLALYMAAILIIVNTGHLGARLVHQLGVSALF